MDHKLEHTGGTNEDVLDTKSKNVIRVNNFIDSWTRVATFKKCSRVLIILVVETYEEPPRSHEHLPRTTRAYHIFDVMNNFIYSVKPDGSVWGYCLRQQQDATQNRSTGYPLNNESMERQAFRLACRPMTSSITIVYQ
jgi:hypothetical protein